MIRFEFPASAKQGGVRPAFWWLIWAILGALGVIAARLTTFKLARQPLFIDFLTFWTGGRMAGGHAADAYRIDIVDRAQAWLLGAAAQDRPFPYPPSTLLLFGPLGHLPFWTAALVWTVLGTVAFATVSLLILPRRRLTGLGLIALTPGVVWAAISGQCALVVGALAIGAVTQLKRRPLLAGMLLGLAATLKPTVLLMAPVALAAGGHWRALIASCVAGGTVILISLSLFGAAPWMAWLSSAPAYLSHMLHDPRFQSGIVTPTGLGVALGLHGWPLILWRVAFAALGLVVAITVFARQEGLAPRLTALFGASLMASPYAMNYETTLLAPGAVLALLTAKDDRAAVPALAAFAALALAGFPGVSAAAFLAFMALSLAPAMLPAPGPSPATAPWPDP